MKITPERLEERFVTAISTTRIYNPNHSLEVFEYYDRTCIQYNESRENSASLDKTKLE